MNTPLEITFKGLDKSASIETKIREKVAKLEQVFSKITHCRVVVAAPNKHAHKGKSYQIKIDVGIPDHPPLILKHETEVGKAQEDLQIALRDAFDIIKRRLDEVAKKIKTSARTERGRRRPLKLSKLSST